MRNCDASGSLPVPEGWTYAVVEERLVEAMQLWRRSPDRERAWLSVRAIWPEITREWALGDYDARGYLGTSSDVPLKPLPIARAEMARMEEAGTWIGRFVPERDRRLVCVALGFKASDRRVPWLRLRQMMGVSFGAAGLSRRYERAIAAVVRGLDRAEKVNKTAFVKV